MKIQLKIITIRIVVLFLIGFQFSCENKPQKKTIKIDEFSSLTTELNEIHKQGNIIGFSVAIVNKDSTLYQKGFGYKDVKKKDLYTENTIQNVASISKTLIGIALLKAQELGKLKLDDPINKYLPYEVKNPHHSTEVITIRHLATHTSTIKDTDFYGERSYVLKDKVENLNTEVANMYVKFNAPETHISMSEFLEKVLPENGEWYLREGYLNKKPGELFEYSNVGATLAAVVLENATGESFKNFTTNHILKPLGMNSSGWVFEDIDITQHTKLYLNAETEIPYYSLITFPDGGLITSVNDLSKYLSELIKGYVGEGTLLKNESYSEFFKKQLKPENFSNQHGENEGIFLGFSSEGLIGHSGGDPGVSTYMFFNPKTKIGRILLVNTVLNEEGNKQYDSILKKIESIE